MTFSKIYNSSKHRTKLVFSKRYRRDVHAANLLEMIDKIIPVGMNGKRKFRKPDFIQTRRKVMQNVNVDAASEELANINDNMLAIQAQIIEATRDFQTELKQYQDRDAELRAAIMHGMEASGTKKFENQYIKLTYIAPTERKGIDTAKLKLLRPEVYAEFEKTTPVKGSVRITLK